MALFQTRDFTNQRRIQGGWVGWELGLRELYPTDHKRRSSKPALGQQWSDNLTSRCMITMSCTTLRDSR